MWTMRHGRLIGEGAAVVQVDDTAEALGAPARARPRRCSATCRRRRTPPSPPWAAPATGYRYRRRRCSTRLAAGGRWRDVPFEDRPTGRRRAHRPAHPHRRAGRPAAGRARRRRRLGQLHGLPEHVPLRAGRAGLLLHPGVPVHRARPGHRRRRGAGPAGPAAGGGAGRRWRPHGGGRAGHGAPPGPADGRRGLQRRRLRRRGAPLRRRRGAAGHRELPAHRPRGHRPRLRVHRRDRARRRATSTPCAAWLAGPARTPLLVDAKVVADEPSWWLGEAFGH